MGISKVLNVCFNIMCRIKNRKLVLITQAVFAITYLQSLHAETSPLSRVYIYVA